MPTERVFVLPPGSQIGPITPEQRQALIAGSLVAGVYEKQVDRESAFEKLKGQAATGAAATGSLAAGATRSTTGSTSHGAPTGPAEASDGGLFGSLKDVLFGSTGPRGGKHAGLAETAAKSAVRTMGSAVGRELVRGVLGSLMGGSRRR